MLSYAIASSLLLAAGAVAVAAPEPAVTPPPSLKHLRRDLGDLFDSASSKVSDIIGDVGDAAECIDKFEDILDDQDGMPTAEGDLGTVVTSYFGDNGNYCAGTAIPPSLSQSWQQYESKFVAWYSAASPAIQSAADACPSVATEIQAPFLPCSTALEAAGITPVAVDQDADNNDSNAASTTDDDNAAPRATGVAVGAAALAMGAVAALL